MDAEQRHLASSQVCFQAQNVIPELVALDERTGWARSLLYLHIATISGLAWCATGRDTRVDFRKLLNEEYRVEHFQDHVADARSGIAAARELARAFPSLRSLVVDSVSATKEVHWALAFAGALPELRRVSIYGGCKNSCRDWFEMEPELSAPALLSAGIESGAVFAPCLREVEFRAVALHQRDLEFVIDRCHQLQDLRVDTKHVSFGSFLRTLAMLRAARAFEQAPARPESNILAVRSRSLRRLKIVGVIPGAVFMDTSGAESLSSVTRIPHLGYPRVLLLEDLL
jgi:hypothetical protein